MARETGQRLTDFKWTPHLASALRKRAGLLDRARGESTGIDSSRAEPSRSVAFVPFGLVSFRALPATAADERKRCRSWRRAAALHWPLSPRAPLCARQKVEPPPPLCCHTDNATTNAVGLLRGCEWRLERTFFEVLCPKNVALRSFGARLTIY